MEQKIQSQKYVEVDERKDPRLVVCYVGHWGKKNRKKMRFKGFKTKEQSQNHGPYVSYKQSNILGTMNGIIHYNS
jgi:hypothetical protein